MGKHSCLEDLDLCPNSIIYLLLLCYRTILLFKAQNNKFASTIVQS